MERSGPTLRRTRAVGAAPRHRAHQRLEPAERRDAAGCGRVDESGGHSSGVNKWLSAFGGDLALFGRMAEQILSLGDVEISRNPAQRRILRGAIAAAVVLHLMLLALFIWKPRTTPVRVSVAHQGSISAYVNVAPAPAGTTGASRPVTKPRPVALATAAKAAPEEPVSNESTGAGQQVAGTAQGGGP